MTKIFECFCFKKTTNERVHFTDLENGVSKALPAINYMCIIFMVICLFACFHGSTAFSALTV